jgi:Protein of unknown function (DUF4239)
MLNYLQGVNSIWQSLTLSLICLFFSFISMLLLRKILPTSYRPKFTDIHGHIFGVIGIIYAVLVGAIAVGSWDKFKHAEELTYKEAMSSLNIYRLADGLEPSKAQEMKKIIYHYVDSVVKNEWDAMKTGKPLELKEPNLIALTNLLTTIYPHNKTQEIFLTFLVEEDIKLREIRGERIFLSASSLNPVILQFVFFSSFLIILASIFFGTEHSFLGNFIVISVLSIVTGLVLTIIVRFDQPFQGDIITSDDPFTSALQLMSSYAK